MHPDLRPYFDHVWPLFWPWLIWNLLRAAARYERTGQDALLMVDCFGNIRISCLGDAPAPDDLYTYEAPDIMPWERLAASVQPLLLGEKGLGMRGRGVAASAELSETPWPLTPTPLPRERGLSALVRGPPNSLSYRTPAALMLSEVEA